MFCTSCSADIGARLPRFCPQCGVPLQAALTPADPAPAASAPDDVSSAHEATKTLLEPDDAIPIPDNSPTLLLLTPPETESQQNPEPTPSSQPDVSTTTFTTVFSGGDIDINIDSGSGGGSGSSKHRRKKRKKARNRAKPSAKTPNVLIEPFIAANTAQDESEPFSSEPEPAFVAETFPPVSLEKDDRIVVEPPYPGQSPVSTQYAQESAHPAILGLAAIILVAFLGGLWWWNSGKTDYFPEDTGAPLPTLSSDPIPDAKPFPTLPPPASPAENTPTFRPEEQLSEQAPELELRSERGLMNIPSLPANQQQGRHNRHNPTEIKDDPPLSLSPDSLPMPTPPKPAFPTMQRQAIPDLPVFEPEPEFEPWSNFQDEWRDEWQPEQSEQRESE